jgi:hypothetical protein
MDMANSPISTRRIITTHQIQRRDRAFYPKVWKMILTGGWPLCILVFNCNKSAFFPEVFHLFKGYKKMVGNIIVIIIVLLAVTFIGRRFYRIFSSKSIECGCEPQDGCSSCSIPSEDRESCGEDSHDSTPTVKV